eukprot:m.185826 g.185826  ORF g.185826 m.185826 type:complete len:519 (-) comp16579_c0_seq1:220-1776(-)
MVACMGSQASTLGASAHIASSASTSRMNTRRAARQHLDRHQHSRTAKKRRPRATDNYIVYEAYCAGTPQEQVKRFSAGLKVEAVDTSMAWYRAEVLNVDHKKQEALVHFLGYPHRFDQIMSFSSPLIRPSGRLESLARSLRSLDRGRTKALQPARRREDSPPWRLPGMDVDPTSRRVRRPVERLTMDAPPPAPPAPPLRPSAHATTPSTPTNDSPDEDKVSSTDEEEEEDVVVVVSPARRQRKNGGGTARGKRTMKKLSSRASPATPAAGKRRRRATGSGSGGSGSGAEASVARGRVRKGVPRTPCCKQPKRTLSAKRGSIKPIRLNVSPASHKHPGSHGKHHLDEHHPSASRSSSVRSMLSPTTPRSTSGSSPRSRSHDDFLMHFPLAPKFVKVEVKEIVTPDVRQVSDCAGGGLPKPCDDSDSDAVKAESSGTAQTEQLCDSVFLARHAPFEHAERLRFAPPEETEQRGPKPFSPYAKVMPPQRLSANADSRRWEGFVSFGPRIFHPSMTLGLVPP